MANILVVQDVEKNALDIKASLDTAGHQILIVKSVNGAITLLRAASFDLLICGVHLSSGGLFDLLNIVKSDPELRNISFFCFCDKPTGLAKAVDDIMRSTAKLLGADKYITHQLFDAEQFRTEIESVLPQKNSELINCASTKQRRANEQGTTKD